MQTKNQISLTRKALYAIMLLGVFLSALAVEIYRLLTRRSQALLCQKQPKH